MSEGISSDVLSFCVQSICQALLMLLSSKPRMLLPQQEVKFQKKKGRGKEANSIRSSTKRSRREKIFCVRYELNFPDAFKKSILPHWNPSSFCYFFPLMSSINFTSLSCQPFWKNLHVSSSLANKSSPPPTAATWPRHPPAQQLRYLQDSQPGL